MNYSATSILLAAWETRAHFGRRAALPLKRYLVRIDVPDEIWEAREAVGRALPVGWDAIPEGLVWREVGTNWLNSGRTALLTVPSLIIDEEANVMLNPAHPDSAGIGATKLRRLVYDHRA